MTISYAVQKNVLFILLLEKGQSKADQAPEQQCISFICSIYKWSVTDSGWAIKVEMID